MMTDRAHPCVSESVRQWVIRIQDAMPTDVRNSQEWRDAAKGIAGSVGTPEDEQARVALLLGWMWDRLGDPAVLDGVPKGVRRVWDRMLTERATYAAADATYAAAAVYAADAADAARAARAARVAAAADVTYAAAADAADAAARAACLAATAGFWSRADLPGTLTALIGTRA